MTPSLSVIVTSGAPLLDAPTLLSSVAEQCDGHAVEIILAYSSDHESLPSMPIDYPNVDFIRLAGEGMLPSLLGAAIERARGRIIAITDATCAVDKKWIAAILESHQGPHPVIGGAVEPDGLNGLVSWAAYFCDYGQFMLPLSEGVVNEVPGNNLSMKRWVLEIGEKFVREEFWKSYWCRQIQAEGFYLYAMPSIIVSYRKSYRLWGYLVHRFHNGRCFAGMRNDQLTPTGRLLFWLGSFLLPILFCWRIGKAVLPKRRHIDRFLLSLPIIILATLSWSLGESLGYLFGPGTSCRHVR